MLFQQKKLACWAELPGNICGKKEKNCLAYIYLNFNTRFRIVGCMKNVKSTIVFICTGRITEF